MKSKLIRRITAIGLTVASVFTMFSSSISVSAASTNMDAVSAVTDCAEVAASINTYDETSVGANIDTAVVGASYKGTTGATSFGVTWKSTVKYTFTSVKDNKKHTVEHNSGDNFNIHYFAKSGQTLNYSDKSQWAFCLQPEADVSMSENGTYGSNDSVAAWNKLKNWQKYAISYLYTAAYSLSKSTYNKTYTSDFDRYYYAAQLLEHEVVAGFRKSDFSNNGSSPFVSGGKVVIGGSGNLSQANITSAYNNLVTTLKKAVAGVEANYPNNTGASEGTATKFTLKQTGTNTYTYQDSSAHTSYPYYDILVPNSYKSYVKVSVKDNKLTITSTKPLSNITLTFQNKIAQSLWEYKRDHNIDNISVMIPSSNNQAVAIGATVYVPKRYISLSTLDQGVMKVCKKSANEDLTANNRCYSLEGAKFQIFTDKACTTPAKNSSGNNMYIVTDKNGVGYYSNSTVNVTASLITSYYVKEIEAPKGFELNPEVFTFTKSSEVNENGIPIYSFTCADLPENDPMYVFIKKVDAVTGIGNADLAGAQFRVNYYDGLYNTPEEVENLTPLRSWVFATDEDGFVEYSDEYKISGDSIYYNKQGYPCLPAGTVSIQEITAPTSGKYKINDTIFIKQVDRLAEVDSELEPINPFVVDEVPNTAGLTIKKTSTDGVVKGLWFRVEGDNGYSKDFEITSDSGLITITDLEIYNTSNFDSSVSDTPQLVKYKVTELGLKQSDGSYKIPQRYTPDRTYQTVTLDADNNVEVSFNNRTPVGKINITKTADDGEIAFLFFRLTGSNGITRITCTSTDGKATFTNLPVYDTNDKLVSYTVEELGVKTGNSYTLPVRYNANKAQTVVFAGAQIYTNNVRNVTFNNTLKCGSLRIIKDAEDGVIENIAFRVQGSSYNEIFYTNKSGAIEISNLPIYDKLNNKINYSVTELGFYDSNKDEFVIPGYYFSPESQTVNLDENNTSTVEVSFYNALRTFNLEVVKTSSDEKVANMWFNVKSDDGSFDTNIVTDSNGNAYCNKLYVYNYAGEALTYTVTELGIKQKNGSYKLPAKYKVLPSQSVSAVEYDTASPDEDINTATLNFFNDEILANLEIVKTAADGKIEGLWFSVASSTGEKFENKATDSEGKINYNDLPVYDDNDNLIEYTVTELGEKQSDGSYKLPYRYNTIKPKTVTLKCSENTNITNTVKFINTLKLGSVAIQKLSETGTPMSDITFELYKSNGTLLRTVKTDGSGYIKINSLVQGDYYVVETKTDAQHSLLKDKISFSIKGDDEISLNPTLTVKNTKKLDIPHTGGDNIVLSLAIGAVIILAVGVIALIRINRKKKSRKDGHKND